MTDFEICELYKTGISLRTIEKRFGIKRHAASEVLKRNGVSVKKRMLGMGRLSYTDKESLLAVEMYTVNKMSLREIADKLGKNHHWVSRRVERNNFEVKRNNKIRVTVKIAPNHRVYKHNCLVCASDFKGAKNQKYCSNKCKGIAASTGITLRPDWIREAANCPQCGNEFVRSEKSTQKYCSRMCFEKSHSVRMAGENNPSYIDGSSFTYTYFRGSDWHQIRREIYKRDGYTCQKCGVKCVSKRFSNRKNSHKIIQCHHIKPYQSPKDNDPSNLVTLCLRCHRSIHLHGLHV